MRIFIQTIAAYQKGKKADSDDLRIIFIQTIATCQKVKKADLRCFDNLVHNGQMPETEKSGLRRFKNKFFQAIATCQKVKEANSNDLRINFIQAIATCQKVKKSGPPMF